MTPPNPVPPQPRASAWEWAQVALLVGNLVWTTFCLGGVLAETMTVTCVLNGAVLVVHLLERAVTWRPMAASHPAGWWLLPFLAYAAANVRWITPVPWLGWRDWLGWAQMIAVFWVVLNGVRSRAPRAALLGAVIVTGMAAVALGFYQVFAHPGWLMLGREQVRTFVGRASGPFGMPNSLAALILLVLPVVIGLTLRRRAGATARVFWGYAALVLAFGLVLTVSRGAWLALALVLILWPVVTVRGSVKRRLVMTALVVAVICGIGAMLYVKVPVVHARFALLWTQAGELSRPIVWRGAWRIFVAQPLGGGGAGSFNVLFDQHRPERFQDQPLWAHNDYLNTLCDYGVAGFALFFGAAATVAGIGVRRAKAAPRRDGLDDRLVAGGMFAGLVAFGVQLFVDFHFKIPALAMAFAAMAGLAVQHGWRVDGFAHPTIVGRIWAALAGLAICAATLCLVAPTYRGEALRYSARRAIDTLAKRDVPDVRWPPVLRQARAGLERGVAIDPANAAAWADLAYVIALEARADPAGAGELGRDAERAADRALAISRQVPEFWIRKGVAQDLEGRWGEAGWPFATALNLAPTRAEFWYYLAHHLSLREPQLGPAQAALAVCLRLDPGSTEAHKLARRLANTPKP